MESLSLAQARRIALAAQGFCDKPHDPPTMRTLQRTVERTGVLQVDSVNVLQRAHFMPLYSRMGAYDVDLLRRASSGQRDRRLVEYWAHVQAYMPVELWPVMRHRMDHYRQRHGKWSIVEAEAGLAEGLIAEIRERGAATARDLDAGLPRAKEHWGWNWSATRRVLDWLFTTGDLAIAGRTSQFEVRYDLPERVIPTPILDLPRPSPVDAHRELARRAARSHGVATVKDLADYYRMSAVDTAVAVATLVDDGELEPVRVEGWARPAYRYRDARLPRRVNAQALLSPFDPLVWERARTEALFDFRYRIEIYTPAHQRVHGYYVLPFLLGDRVVGRVDLKADRQHAAGAGRLIVKAAYAEPGAPGETAERLAAELGRLAGWLKLAEIVVEPRGDLAPALSSLVSPVE